jgi:hypothetical protein
MFIYDEALRLHISTNPLLISSRVWKAARNIDPNLRVQWDEHAFVCVISHDVATKLTKALGVKMLNVKDFMQLAHRHPQLQSEHFAERLSDTYQLREFVDVQASHAVPTILHQDPSSFGLLSSSASLKMLIARPGWIHLDDIGNDGLPKKLCSLNQSGHWKFWSPESTQHALGALRGFVSSSGTCSLDLRIPNIARHPKIMIREVYEKVIAPDPSPLVDLWPIYERLTRSKDCDTLRGFLDGLDLDRIMIEESEDEFTGHREQERLIDMRGKKRIMNRDTKDLMIINKDHLLDTLRLAPGDGTCFVMGHRHPDADSIVSSIFEAVRRCLVYAALTFVPWSESVPREVRYILGDEATTLMSKTPSPGENNNIVLVDRHRTDTKYQMQVRAIIDHHIIDRNMFPITSFLVMRSAGYQLFRYI